MRAVPVLAIAAPLALALSACGGKETAEPADTATTAAAPATTAAAAGEFPAVPLDARGTVNYAGTYAMTGPDGRQQTITLGDGDSYTIRNADGTETSGTFNWYSDNSRILIGSGDAKQVYAVADGVVYRMADENAAIDGPKTAEMTFRRVTDAAM